MCVEATQLLKGVLPTVVLAAIEDGNVYGYSILKALRAAGHTELGDASVYGTLQRLYADGLISSYMDESERGPARKCYALTPAGEHALARGRDSWNCFKATVDAVLLHGKES